MLTLPPVQVRAADVELLSGSPEGHPLATAARRWAAFDGHTGALHQLNDSSDFVAVQLDGASQLRILLAQVSRCCVCFLRIVPCIKHLSICSQVDPRCSARHSVSHYIGNQPLRWCSSGVVAV